MPTDDPIARADNAELALQSALLTNEDDVKAIRYALEYLEDIDAVLKDGLLEPVKPLVLKKLMAQLPESATGENEVEQAFDVFWEAYPRKIGKPAALLKFRTKNCTPILTTLLKAIDAHKKSQQWVKDGGEYIPHPATWLNQERWDDEISTGTQSSGGWVGKAIQKTA